MVKRGDLRVHASRSRSANRTKRVGDGLASGDINFNRPNLYYLPGTRIPIDDKKLYGHELDIADCFVALRQRFGEQLTRWQLKWDKGEEYNYLGERWKVFPDAVFELEDHDAVFFLEVDRGTMEWEQIADKLSRYARFSNAHPESRFHVLFTAQGYRHDKEDRERLERLLPMLEVHKRGNQFVAACHDEFLADPTAAIFHSPVDTAFELVRVKNRPPYKLVEKFGTPRCFLTLE